MPKTKTQILEDIKYLFSKINWGSSFLDAQAVGIMNTLSQDIQAISMMCEDVDEKTISAIVSKVLEENSESHLDLMEERAFIADALVKALTKAA